MPPGEQSSLAPGECTEEEAAVVEAQMVIWERAEQPLCGGHGWGWHQ